MPPSRQKAAAFTPYGISKVTTIDGEVIYSAKPQKSIQLVEDWVAGGMTDLMQTAVATGTGRAANIGRPVAGKTGTTSSNKDGWFLGFSSGLTTGVWMGRDNARAVGGLEGGRAPAQAWAAFMRVAVAGRPVEQFATDVTFPERLEGGRTRAGEMKRQFARRKWHAHRNAARHRRRPHLAPNRWTKSLSIRRWAADRIAAACEEPIDPFQ